jgi:bifunctional non-homologous end joining protein LigD
MLAHGSCGIPVNLNDWAVEPKWDGWRCQARMDGGRVRLTSRWRNDLTSRFPELGKSPEAIKGRQLLLDGELVALRPDGSQDFHALMGRRRNRRLVFVAFDLLHVDGLHLADAPYAVRRRELEQLGVRDHHWRTTPSERDDAAGALFGLTLEQGWQGIVAKRLDSPYRPAARDGAWLKAKHPHARDLQVDRAGWSARRGTTRESTPTGRPWRCPATFEPALPCRAAEHLLESNGGDGSRIRCL